VGVCIFPGIAGPRVWKVYHRGLWRLCQPLGGIIHHHLISSRLPLLWCRRHADSPTRVGAFPSRVYSMVFQPPCCGSRQRPRVETAKESKDFRRASPFSQTCRQTGVIELSATHALSAGRAHARGWQRHARIRSLIASPRASRAGGLRQARSAQPPPSARTIPQEFLRAFPSRQQAIASSSGRARPAWTWPG